MCVGRQRRTATRSISKSGSLGACRSHSVPRHYTPRDHADYMRRAGRQWLSGDVSTTKRCDCLFHPQDPFQSSTILTSRTTPPEPLYAHASSTPFPSEVVSVVDRKRLQEAAILFDDAGSFSVDCGSGVDGYIVGRDVTLHGSRDHCQPDIVA